MHENMVFSRDSIFPTPQQSRCLCECSVEDINHAIYTVCAHVQATRNLSRKNSRVLSPKSEKAFSYCLGVTPDQHPLSMIKLSVNKLYGMVLYS